MLHRAFTAYHRFSTKQVSFSLIVQLINHENPQANWTYYRQSSNAAPALCNSRRLYHRVATTLQNDDHQNTAKKRRSVYTAGSISMVVKNALSLDPRFLVKFLLQQSRLNPSVLKNEEIAKIAQIIQTRSKELTYRDVIKLLEACSLLNFVDFDLFKKLAVQIIGSLSALSAKDCSILAFSFSKLGISYAPVYAALSTRFAVTIKTAFPEDLMKIAIAFGRLSLKDEQLFRYISEQSILQLSHFTATELCHILVSFALANIQPQDELIRRSLRELKYRMGAMTAQELALIAFSFAKFGIPDPDVLANLEKFMLAAPAPPIEHEKGVPASFISKTRKL